MAETPSPLKPKVYNLDLDAIGPNTKATEALAGFTKKFNQDLASAFQSPGLQLSKTISQLADNILKSNQEAYKKLFENMPRFTLPSSTFYVPLTPIVHELRPIESPELAVEKPIPKAKSHRRKMGFGLYFITGNSIQFKRKTLKALSLETQHGKLLEMFLSAEGHFVPDNELLAEFSKSVLYDISHILRNLRNAFRENGLIIDIERRKIAKGYVLIDIKKDKIIE